MTLSKQCHIRKLHYSFLELTFFIFQIKKPLWLYGPVLESLHRTKSVSLNKIKALGRLMFPLIFLKLLLVHYRVLWEFSLCDRSANNTRGITFWFQLKKTCSLLCFKMLLRWQAVDWPKHTLFRAIYFKEWMNEFAEQSWIHENVNCFLPCLLR